MPRVNTLIVENLTKFKRRWFIKQTKKAAAAAKAKPIEEIKTQTFSDILLKRKEDAIRKDLPHFKVGEKQVYFPKARVILLRPNAKHTPYQAKFIVPKAFNRLDLRDYLYHVYGLRALNVTVQLSPGVYKGHPGTPRYRASQIKKMTIEMEDPFIWPEQTFEENNEIDDQEKMMIEYAQVMRNYNDEVIGRTRSDLAKPIKSFGGMIHLPDYIKSQPFVPKFAKRRLQNKVEKAEEYHKLEREKKIIENYLKSKNKLDFI
ncbi:mitochondrial 54S ribosomal protein uL23m ASCRUDRAFT_7067 [Ascoidea rubescens DSM 1968]|uniref:Large ribosomal subunit protein uL23m n=1 Tax=Ascoidea rubescens DSM 1968 TaxID=1344418 RepID=A0A1D2VLM5_9ASCO|nr:hypothetical protein ASCRUDRAFT_7067 [Ascoidea rubescens DSM 1968]ODV62509.1 hypothetical protein ASCRUDRAFT_7067 [Ascoidea rubescens DSM 1968]